MGSPRRGLSPLRPEPEEPLATSAFPLYNSPEPGRQAPSRPRSQGVPPRGPERRTLPAKAAPVARPGRGYLPLLVS